MKDYAKDTLIWKTSALLLVAQGAPELFTMGFGPLSPFLVSAFGLTEVQIGLCGSGMALGSLMIAAPSGRYIDLAGPWRPMVWNLAALPLVFLSLSLAPGFLAIALVCVMAGMSRGIAGIASAKAVMVSIPRNRRAMSMGIVHTGSSLAGVISATFLPLLAVAFGWRWGPRVFALGLIPVALWIAFAFARNRAEARSADGGKQGSVLSLLKDPKYVVCMLVWALLVIGMFSFLMFFALYLTEALAVEPRVAGLYLGVAQFTAVVARPSLGALSDRLFGAHRERTIILTSGIAAASFLALGLLPPGPAPVLVILVGFGAGATILALRPLATTWATEAVRLEDAGKALSVLSAVTWTSVMLMAPVFGYVIVLTGSWRLAWFIVAGLVAACVPILLLRPVEGKR